MKRSKNRSKGNQDHGGRDEGGSFSKPTSQQKISLSSLEYQQSLRQQEIENLREAVITRAPARGSVLLVRTMDSALKSNSTTASDVAKKQNHRKGERDEEGEGNLEEEVKPDTGVGSNVFLPNNLFTSLPISSATLKGLKNGKYEEMTEIQRHGIPHALAGRDILGAARTGSGKTLSFVIPLLEKLFRESWSISDDLGGLIITPTRELALQIFEVLRIVGKYHDLSAGLITGGKKEFREEQIRLVRMNIVVATPGRLLQHLRETPGFNPENLQILIFDEADRCLDMGFMAQINSIMQYLPRERQTLLYSATQTKSVRDLARLSLNNRDDRNKPEYIGVREKLIGEDATPASLIQNYLVVPLHEKINTLWSFLRSHTNNKIIVFTSSCSQVRYLYELLRPLQPGIPILPLHGKIKHRRRTLVYLDFVRREHAALICTDIAARGLDFPACDWVLQLDTPEDAAMYIHRVGRTARYKSGGRSLLCVLPNEERGLVNHLTEAKIPITKLTQNPKKLLHIQNKVASTVASNAELKRLGQKAFTSYLRSLSLMPNKEVFSVKDLDFAAFAESLGLSKQPSIKFLKEEVNREMVRENKNKNRALEKIKEQVRLEKLSKRLNKSVEEIKQDTDKKKSANSRKYQGHNDEDDTSNSEDDDIKTMQEDDDQEEDEDNLSTSGGGLFSIKRKHRWDEEGNDDDKDENDDDDGIVLQPRKKPKRIKIRSADAIVGEGKKTVFKDSSDEDEKEDDEKSIEVDFDKALHDQTQISNLSKSHDAFISRIEKRLAKTKDEDKERHRERVREKHRKKRLRQKGLREDGEDEGYGTYVLAENSDNDDNSSDSDAESDKTDTSYNNDSDTDDYDSDQMQEENDSNDDDDDDVKPRKEKRGKSKDLSLAEQEKLALERLRSGAF